MSAVVFNDYHDEVNRKRLLDIAETRTTDPGTVASIIRNSIGEDIDRVARIVRGESNEVYQIHTKQNKDVILRIGHSNNNTFEREAWAIDRAASVGVPVPMVLAVGEHSSVNKTVHYCIQEQLKGTTLDTLLYSTKLPIDRAKSIVEKAGEALGRLHSIKTTGWGYLVQPTTGELADFNDKYTKVEKEAAHIEAALKATKVFAPPIGTILEQYKSCLRVFVGNQRLTHGDYGPKHIFVNEQDNISAVIDWEQVESDDPVVDIARWNFWFEDEAPVAWLIAGHNKISSSNLQENYDERFRIAKLESAIWTLLYFTYDSAVNDRALQAAQALVTATKS